MRDLILSATIFAGVPLAFARPWIGVLFWSWIGYMNPHRLTWGFAYDLPFAKIMGGATLAGLLLSAAAKPLPRTRLSALLLAFWLWTTLTTLLARYPALAWPQWQETSKIFLMTFVTMLLFQDLERIRYLVLTIALSIAAFGVRSGVVGLLTGFASLQYVYPDQSFIADNNDLALALNLVLPLLLLLGQIERRPLLKAGFYAIFGLSILGVLSTFSRGGFLGLAATIAMLVARSRRRLLNLTLLILGGFLVASLLSTSWYERIASISEYEEDGSAQGRLQAWTVATKLALDSPLTGWGFRSLQPETYWKYGFDTVRKELVAHSIFFQVLGDQGFVGLGLFLALVGSAIVSLQRVALLSAITPSRIGLAGLARAIQTGLIGFLVSGAFLSRAYFDLPYHLIAIAVVLTTLAGSEASAAAEDSDAVAAAARWPLPVRAR